MNDNKKLKKISMPVRIILWCAGVDVELIESCSNTVILKYAALGGLVLTPALLAFPSASYFLLDTLLPKTAEWAIYAAATTGFIWSLVVLNFDRYLVISFTKSGSALKDLFSFSVIMRIIMAGFIAFVIAHPLVLAMFRGNLEESLFNSKTHQRTAIIQKYDGNIKNLDQELNALIAKNSEKRSLDLTEDSTVARELKGKIEAKQQEIHSAESEYADEVGGNVKSRTQRPGEGPTALAIKTRIGTLKTDLAQLNTELNEEKTKQVENSQLKKDMLVKDNQSFEQMRQANSTLIQEKIHDLDKLKADKKDALQKFDTHVSFDFLTLSNELDALSKANKNVYLWKWLLTGLLFVIDLFAVLLKVLSDKDNYDDKKQTESYLETSNQKAKRDACLKSEAERVNFEHKKERYQVKQAEFQLVCDSHLARLSSLTSFMENINSTTNRFNKLFSHHNVDPAYAKTIIDDYSKVSEAVFNDVLNQFRMTATE